MCELKVNLKSTWEKDIIRFGSSLLDRASHFFQIEPILDRYSRSWIALWLSYRRFRSVEIIRVPGCIFLINLIWIPRVWRNNCRRWRSCHKLRSKRNLHIWLSIFRFQHIGLLFTRISNFTTTEGKGSSWRWVSHSINTELLRWVCLKSCC